MENLTIESTKYTPQIVSDIDKGAVQFYGKSYPENTFEFYEPVMNWVEAFVGAAQQPLTFEFEILYYNSSSAKAFYDLFDLLEEACEEGKAITVIWYHYDENESMKDSGEDFAEDFESLQFTLQEKQPE